MVLDAEGMVDMDISGAETLTALLDDLDDRDVRLVLARVRSGLRKTLRRLDLEERLGAENIHLSVRDAVRAAVGHLQAPADPTPVPNHARADGSSGTGVVGPGTSADGSSTDR